MLRDVWRGPAWPLAALLLLYPLWWALGLSLFIGIFVAVPMAWYLLRLERVVVPPGFGWWLGFLALVVASGAMLGATPAGTLEDSFASRVPAYGLRFLDYVSATIVMLFAINLPGGWRTTRRIVSMQAWFCVAVVVGGLAGWLLPSVSFTTPLGVLVPTNNRFLEISFTASLAQVQGVLGYEAPRPSAPFFYTNTWGNMLSILLVWLVVAAWVWGGRRARVATALVVAVAAVPIVMSLNRGLWVGLVVSVLYVVVRAGLRGNVRVVAASVVASTLAGILFLVSPLSGLVTQRLDNPHSNSARENTSLSAVQAAVESPVLGYGSTRTLRGSSQSIAVGRSPSCPQCGNAAIGGAGQTWLLLIAQGFLGLALYVGFFLHQLAVHGRGRSVVSTAGVLVVLLSLFYMFVYTANGMPLITTMLAVALLHRDRFVDPVRQPEPSAVREVTA